MKGTLSCWSLFPMTVIHRGPFTIVVLRELLSRTATTLELASVWEFLLINPKPSWFTTECHVAYVLLQRSVI